MYISVFYSTPITYMELEACEMWCLQIHFCFGDIITLSVEWYLFERNYVICTSEEISKNFGKIAQYLAATNYWIKETFDIIMRSDRYGYDLKLFS